MPKEQVLIVVGLLTAAIVVAILIVAGRHSRAIRDLLKSLASAASWTDLRHITLGAGVKGLWRSFPASFTYHARHKSTPQRLILKVRTRPAGRLIVRRRFPGVFSNKPMTWFGPPLIEVLHAGAEELWVRGDAMLAERVFANERIAKTIGENVVARFDEIRIDGSGLRITRALDDRAVEQKYNLPSFEMRFNADRFLPIAREELALAEMVMNAL